MNDSLPIINTNAKETFLNCPIENLNSEQTFIRKEAVKNEIKGKNSLEYSTRRCKSMKPSIGIHSGGGDGKKATTDYIMKDVGLRKSLADDPIIRLPLVI